MNGVTMTQPYPTNHNEFMGFLADIRKRMLKLTPEPKPSIFSDNDRDYGLYKVVDLVQNAQVRYTGNQICFEAGRKQWEREVEDGVYQALATDFLKALDAQLLQVLQTYEDCLCQEKERVSNLQKELKRGQEAFARGQEVLLKFRIAYDP